MSYYIRGTKTSEKKKVCYEAPDCPQGSLHAAHSAGGLQCQLTLHLGQFRLSDMLPLPLLISPKPPPPMKRKGYVASQQWRRAEPGAGRHRVLGVPWLALHTLLGPDSCCRPGVLQMANLCFILPAPGKLWVSTMSATQSPGLWRVACSAVPKTGRLCVNSASIVLNWEKPQEHQGDLAVWPHCSPLLTRPCAEQAPLRIPNGGVERGPPPLTALHSLCPDASTPHATAASPTSAKKGKQDDISRLTCLLSLLHHLLGSEKTVFPYLLVWSTLPLPETMTRPAKPFYRHTKRTDEKIQIICSNNVEHKAWFLLHNPILSTQEAERYLSLCILSRHC